MAAKLFAVRLAPDRIPVLKVRRASSPPRGVKEMYDKRMAKAEMGYAGRCGWLRRCSEAVFVRDWRPSRQRRRRVINPAIL